MNDNSIQQNKYMSMQPDLTPNDSTLKWFWDFKSEIDELIFTFAGFDYDTKLGKWVDHDNKIPLCNKEGLRYLRAELTFSSSKSLPQTNFDDKDVEEFTTSFSSRVRKSLFVNRHRFGVKNASDAAQIKGQTVDKAWLMAKMAVGDKGRGHMLSPLKQVENRTVQATNTQPINKRLGW